MADMSEFTTVAIIAAIILPLLIFLLCWFFLAPAGPHSSSNSTPCPRSYPLIGNTISLLANVDRFYDWMTDLFSDSSSLTIKINTFLGISHTIINTINPTNIEYILKSNFHNYVKGTRFSDNLQDLLGHGIFNVDAQLWSLQRKIASHEFNTKSLKSFTSRTVQFEITNRLIPYLSYYADHHEKDEVIDLQDIFQKLTFDNICNLAFGVDPGCLDVNDLKSLSKNNSSSCSTSANSSSKNSTSFVSAFDEAAEICTFRIMSPFPLIWKLKRFLNVGSERRLRNAIKVIDDYAMDVIRSKEDRLDEAADSDKQDLLSRFMCSNIQLDFDNPEQKKKFYRDIITNFILAGRDTTSSALTWFFWLIAGHPRCVRSIYAEISSVMSTKEAGDDQVVLEHLISYDDFKNFHYLHAALTESMRLFPPVPINSKLAIKDDILPDGTKVSAGWCADYMAYAMGRMEEVWGNDCKEFKPERWLDDDGVFKPCSQFKFPVFHCGPRICLGKDMAYVQMKAVAAAVIYNFEVVAVDGGATMEKMLNPPYVVSLVLKMKHGLPVKLKRRQH